MNSSPALPASALTGLIETVPCPICGASDFGVVYPAKYPPHLNRDELLKIYSSSSDHLLMDQLVRCRNCSLYYLNPRVRAEIIMDSYSNAVDPVFLQQNPMRIATFRRSLQAMLKRFGIRPDASKKVLDVGCAGGAFPKAAADLGFSVTGIEPSAWLSEAGRKAYGLDLRAGTLEDHAFPPDHFFMVTLWDVLEHLNDPAGMLKRIHPLLRRDGFLIVNLPDYNSLVSRCLGSRWPFLLSVHLSYFTPETLGRLLDLCGFRVRSVSPHFQTLELGYALQRAAHYGRPFKWLEQLIHKTSLGRLPLLYNMGQMRVVAQKK